ncbi:hypothetical protein PENTCL1PPCAC_14262, partial [Pristionchus entomophagus]
QIDFSTGSSEDGQITTGGSQSHEHYHSAGMGRRYRGLDGRSHSSALNRCVWLLTKSSHNLLTDLRGRETSHVNCMVDSAFLGQSQSAVVDVSDRNRRNAMGEGHQC